MSEQVTWSHPDRNPSKRMLYPTTGAFQHLPIQTTLTGDPSLTSRHARDMFLRDLPAHCFALPTVPLSFTIVEMLVFLPNWFKNKALCARFMNNKLTAGVHFTILEEHRDLRFGSDVERDRARKLLADEYRKTMRKVWTEWTKHKHTAPANWNALAIGMDGFLPDDVSDDDYRTVPNVLIKDLAIGVKKMPQGTAAGDLTRAVLFALENKHEFRFPGDLPTVLDHIGRTHLTTAHTDRMLVRAYTDLKRVDDNAYRALRQQFHEDGKADDVPFLPQMKPHHGQDESKVQAGTPLRKDSSPSVLEGQQNWAQNLAQNTLRNMGAMPQDAAVTVKAEPAQFNRSIEEMEDLLREHLVPVSDQVQTPPAPPATGRYPLGYPLRDCVEGSMAFDGSLLARAAKFAQRPDQLGIAWKVEHTIFLNQVLDAAQSEFSESLFEN